MQVIVSGGCGFLGSHLVDRLVERGDEVTVVDNLWTGTMQFRSHDAMYHICDVSSPRQMGSALLEKKFDRVYHLASPASPPKYMSDPDGTMMANFMGARILSRFLRPGGRFCFTSTSEVYGDPLVSPLPETYSGSVNCNGPRAGYDESKRATEAWLHEMRRTQGLDIRCARIFNAYGPRTQPDDGRCVSNFITRGLAGLPLQVMGDGAQTRCFTYVDCIVEGLMRYWDLEYSARDHFVIASAVPTTMNIGLDRETTVLEIAEHVARDLGVGIEHIAPAVDDPRQRRPDLARARLWMPDWDPARIPYEEGVRLTVEHFRQRSHA